MRNAEIAVTLPADIPAYNKIEKKLLSVGLHTTYVRTTMSKAEQDRIYDTASGLLLPGGKDIHPSTYGAAPHPTVTQTHKQLDALELKMVKRARQDKKPVFGICRGAQLLGVEAGGTLIQHIPDEIKRMNSDEKHGVSIDKYDNVYPSSIYHEVFIRTGTQAFDILRKHKIYVPSRHHQAIKDPGTLMISGVSPAGIVEIVEDPTREFHIGTQIHVEMVDTLDAFFGAFASAVKASR